MLCAKMHKVTREINGNTERGLESRSSKNLFIFKTQVNIERVREGNGFPINNASIIIESLVV
jgi:hypothetical protein